MTENAPRRVGIVGGTFNPVHLGHLLLAQSACEALGLTRVLFVPCHQPPHKQAPALAAPADRLAMLERAIRGDARFECCDLEIRRGGVSYSVDTLRALTASQPGTEFIFIIGADGLADLHAWREIATLLSLCRFAVVPRPGFDLKALTPAALRLPAPLGERLLQTILPVRQIEVSSSEIRQRLARGLGIRYLVPEAVADYIAERRLYMAKAD